ncbi:type II secretion system protein [Thermosynechococcus sp. HY213]|uniref:PulJ/GspJ family protein n=1 Tax=Thermosynechococcus sp. HY213 TaxID=3074104 RepID=UPI002859581C|nr:type II secretion system protein [Thermosynechococcus sp. HY213]MDR7922269.1 type II secretion system protein [Thermosynechococcus sp. HY213]
MKLLGWWRRRSKGFTITEILVSLVIAGVITASLGSILIDMIQTESREAALNQLRQDLKATLDVISTDLSQAVFVYNGNCLAGSGSCGDTSRSEPLTNYLPDFPNTMRPVLAMWILEPFPYYQNQLGYARFVMPRDCSRVWSTDQANAKAHCQELRSGRRSYTLVVYYIDTARQSFWSPESDWQGQARLVRYQLRKYKEAARASDANYDWLGINQGYVDPTGRTNFARWPIDVQTGANLQSSRPVKNIEGYLRVTDLTVVTDFIDTDTSMPRPDCPTGTIRTPRDTSDAPAPAGFFACVQERGSSFNAATFVYLRGNPQGLPGIREEDIQNRPVLTTTVLSRSVQGKVPNF